MPGLSAVFATRRLTFLTEQRDHGDVHPRTAARLGRPPLPPEDEGSAARWVLNRALPLPHSLL